MFDSRSKIKTNSSSQITLALKSHDEKQTKTKDRSCTSLISYAFQSSFKWVCDNTRWLYMNSPKWVCDNARRLYMISPINGSYITGYRYPHLPRLWSWNPIGDISLMASENVMKTLHEADLLMKNNKVNRCYTSFANKRALFICEPSDISQVFFFNDTKVERNSTLDLLSHVFSPDIILASQGNTWKYKKSLIEMNMSNPRALKKLAPMMQKILDEVLNEMPEGEFELQEFATHVAMKTMLQTQLGIQENKPLTQELSKFFDYMLREVMDTYNNIFYGMGMKEPIDKLKQKMEELISRYLMLRNADPNTLLNQTIQYEFKEQQKSKQMSQEEKNITEQKITLSETAFLSLAGHETTSRLIQFSTMLLARHPEVLVKVLDEIKNNLPCGDEWTSDDLKKLPYLYKVLMETLRLYSPVPIIPREAMQDFIIGELDKNPSTIEEYKKAMDNRDKTRDVKVSKGDYIFVMAYLTSRLSSIYENPEAFNPDRFSDSEIQKPDRSKFLAFSAGHRRCPGEKFSMQEAMLALIKFLKAGNFKINEKYQHPFNVKMVGTLKSAIPVNVSFIKHSKEKANETDVTEQKKLSFN